MRWISHHPTLAGSRASAAEGVHRYDGLRQPYPSEGSVTNNYTGPLTLIGSASSASTPIDDHVFSVLGTETPGRTGLRNNGAVTVTPSFSL